MASRRQQQSQAAKYLETFAAENGSTVRGWTEGGDTKVTIITTGPVRWTRFGSDEARVYPSDCVFPMEVKVPKNEHHLVYEDDNGDNNEDMPHGLAMGKTADEDGYQRWKSVPSLNSKWNKAETPPLSVPKSWKATLTAMQASKQASEPSRTGHYVLERLTADMPPSSKMQEKGLMITEGDIEITYEMVFDPEESIDLINDLSTV